MFKVGGKMFALIPLEKIPLQINLKCDPEKAIELREKYDCIAPGWHMNKKYWNTIVINGEVRWSEIKEWINHSYDEVISKFKKSDQRKFKH